MKNNKKTPLFKGNLSLEALRKLKDKGIQTVTEVLILFFIAEGYEALDHDGHPPTLVDVTRALKLPFSTASRVIFHLNQLGYVEYKQHRTDRRKKVLIADLAKLEA